MPPGPGRDEALAMTLSSARRRTGNRTAPTTRRTCRAAGVTGLTAGILLAGCTGTPWAATGAGAARVGITHASGTVGVSPFRSGRPLARAAGLGVAADGLHAVWGASGPMPAGAGSGTVVAIVDSGADLGHPSLQGHLWSNPGEIAGNGVDDDANGYVDDVHGVNILAPRRAPDDEYGHGTAVAGLVAAGDGTADGVTGAAPGARLMIVRILSAVGEGTTDQLADGIAYAVRNGASVINCSVNSDVDSPAVDTAIRSAERAGIPVVAAAGNDGLNLDERAATYPAETDSAAVVSVAATQAPGRLAVFSNYGRASIDLAAPGVDLASTAVDASFTTVSGTSASAPLVSATLAHERAQRPQSTLRELRAVLLHGARRGQLPLVEGELDAPATLTALTGRPDTGPVTVTLSVAPAVRLHGVRVALRARWSTRDPLAGPVSAVLLVRRGSGHGRILSTRRVVLRGAQGTIKAAPIARTVGRDRLWLELRTTASSSASGMRIAVRASR